MRILLHLTICVGIFPALVNVGRAVEDDIVIKKQPTAGSAIDLSSIPGRRYALLVGVNDYTYFSDLTFCNADINNLSQALQQSGFDARDLTVLRDGLPDHHLLPYRNNILTQVKNLLESVRANDLVIVAFSGHGVHLDGKSYLCPADAQLDRADETMIPLDRLYDLLQECQASQKLLIVDACRNDPTPSGTRSPAGIEQTNEFTRSLQQQQPPAGTMLFNSCAPNQFSVEDPDFKSGVFMHYVIEGLRGAADADKDMKVSLFELYRYAEYETKTHVRRTRNLVQTPVLKGEVTGVYELAVVSDNPAEPPKPDFTPARQPTVNVPAQSTDAVATVQPTNPLPTKTPESDEAALTKSVVEAHPLLKQGNQYFAEGRYDAAITAFTNVIQVEENKSVVREAFKRRSAAYLAADAGGNVMKALSDSQAAGRPHLAVQVRGEDAKLMDAERTVAQVKRGQIVEISSVNGSWLQVVSLEGNDSIAGWLHTKYLSEPKPKPAPPPQVVVVPQQPRPQYPQYPQYPQNPRPYPPHNGGHFPPQNPPGNSAGEQLIQGIQREILRQILK